MYVYTVNYSPYTFRLVSIRRKVFLYGGAYAVIFLRDLRNWVGRILLATF